MITLDQLPPEILALLNQNGLPTRTGARPVLTDLREPRTPKEKLNRPNFFWSADEEPGKPPYRHQEFPKIKWQQDGDQIREVLVRSADEEAALIGAWSNFPPLVAPQTTADAIQAQLDALTPEERQLVFEAQRQQRMAALQAKLAAMPDAQLAKLMAADAAGEEPAKRGPGRPRKVE